MRSPNRGDDEVWCVSISSELVVAFVRLDVIRLEKPGVPYSPSLIRLDKADVEDADVAASAQQRKKEIGLAWASSRTLVCGDGRGLVRVFAVGEMSWSQVHTWSLRDLPENSVSTRKRLVFRGAPAAKTPKHSHDEYISLWPEGSSVWYRYGRRCVRIESSRVLGLKRLLPTDTMACSVSVDATSFLVAGRSGQIFVYSWSPEEADSGASLSFSALGTAVWGAFFPTRSKTNESVHETFENETIHLIRSVGDLAQFMAPAAELPILEDQGRSFERVCTSPQGRYAALSDDRGRVVLVACRPAPAVIAGVFKGYRKAQCAFVPKIRGLAILSPESRVVHLYLLPCRTLAAVYALEAIDPKLSVAQGYAYLCTATNDHCSLLRLETKLVHSSSEKASSIAKKNYAALRSFRSARRSGDAAATLTALARCYSREDNDDTLLARALDDACNELSCADALLRTILDAAIERCTSTELRSRLERMRELALAAAKAGIGSGDEVLFSTPSNHEYRSELSEIADWLKIPENETNELQLVSQVSAALKQQVSESIPFEEEEDTLGIIFRGAAVWQALAEETSWSSAHRASCLGAIENTEEKASVLITAARTTAKFLMRPIATGDIFGLRAMSDLATVLNLGHGARARLCTHWLTTEIPITMARHALLGPVLSRYLKDSVLPEGIDHLLSARWDTHRPARVLSLFFLASVLMNELVETEEKRTYGTADKSAFTQGMELLETSIHQLRVTALLCLGPPRCSKVTLRALDTEALLLADILQEDAACAEDEEAVQNVGDLANAILNRPERGWVHRCFPEFEPEALRICYALRLAAPQAAALLRTAFFRLRSLVNDDLQQARLALVVAAVCAVWRQAAAGPLLAALEHHKGNDHEHQPIVRAASQLVDVLLEAFKQDALAPPNESSIIMRVDDLIKNGGSAFASGDTWPSHRLTPALATAWQHFRDRPPAPERVKQLTALCRCLQLVLAAPAAGLPLACVSDLFGLAEEQHQSSLDNGEHYLLQLHTAPRDDLAAFADMAEATLTNALSSPQLAEKLRAAALARRSGHPQQRGNLKNCDDHDHNLTRL